MGRSFVPIPRSAISIETSARCNLACRFCAYPKRGPGNFMTMERFSNSVEQACENGISEFWLTPMLGEVFADPNWIEKFQFLEDHERVGSFNFFTNFILPSPHQISKLSQFKKLSELHISVYGHDHESFKQISSKPCSQYDRLIKNLSALESMLPETPFPDGVHISIRTLNRMSFEQLPDSEMMLKIHALLTYPKVTGIVSLDYDSWAGHVSHEDVENLGIEITDGKRIYMHGACSVLFSMPQIAVDGSVRACACRDLDGSLTLGNLDVRPLTELYSWSNPKFREIVKTQQQGRFNDNCRSCSMYRSIYDHRSSGSDGRWPTVPLEGAIKMMGGKAD